MKIKMKETLQVSNEKEFKLTRAIDLINRVKTEPRPKVIWNSIPEGAIGLFTGVAKTGKTTFAENLAISLSVGRKEFFGHTLSGTPKKVLFINLEESYCIRSWRNAKQVKKLTANEYQLFRDNYLSTPTNFPEYINTEIDWQILSNYISKSDAKIVFIDSITNMFSGKIEDSESCRKFIQKLQRYIVSLKKTFIIIHHNTKGNEKPISQDNVAGSRVILQYFQFIYGFANIPTEIGGKYMCSLTNKYFGIDTNYAILYDIDKYNWLRALGNDNKYNLYKSPSTKFIDFRTDSTNVDLIYDYISSQTSQDSKYTLSSDLLKKFVTNSTRTMSKDTLYISLKKLSNQGKIEKIGIGKYKLKMKENDEARKQ